VQVRADSGAATALDVAQQRTTLLNIQADIPALEQSLGQTQTALAVLLGRVPQGFAVRGQSLAEVKLPAVDAGQPASLLERRPDIRSSEARLIAANADIGAARAALYPSVSLSAAAGIEGVLTGGTTTIASIAASLAQSIFDGGARRGQVEIAQGVRQELVENYAQSVLIGLKEVEDSLIAESSTRQRTDILIETVGQARTAYQLATVRYQAGMQDLLTVLDSQRSQLSAEDSLVQAQLGRYTATINLFKSLGGGWSSGGRA
jgi:NodT family efflux transporter outer membrane factor (OMF) lipoprotein